MQSVLLEQVKPAAEREIKWLRGHLALLTSPQWPLLKRVMRRLVTLRAANSDDEIPRLMNDDIIAESLRKLRNIWGEEKERPWIDTSSDGAPRYRGAEPDRRRHWHTCTIYISQFKPQCADSIYKELEAKLIDWRSGAEIEYIDNEYFRIFGSTAVLDGTEEEWAEELFSIIAKANRGQWAAVRIYVSPTLEEDGWEWEK